MITANICRTPQISASVAVSDRLTAHIGVYLGGADGYTGPYQVVPKAKEKTVLETKGKTMSENVVVLEVPYYETSNTTGGNTVYIATQSEV